MDIHSIHNVLITLHAASGILGFFAGCLLIFSRGYVSNGRLFGLYWWFLVGLVVFLVSAMLVYWTQYSNFVADEAGYSFCVQRWQVVKY